MKYVKDWHVKHAGHLCFCLFFSKENSKVKPNKLILQRRCQELKYDGAQVCVSFSYN